VIAGQAQPRDLVAMRNTLEQLPKIKEVIGDQLPALPKEHRDHVSETTNDCEECSRSAYTKTKCASTAFNVKYFVYNRHRSTQA